MVHVIIQVTLSEWYILQCASMSVLYVIVHVMISTWLCSVDYSALNGTMNHDRRLQHRRQFYRG